MRRFGAARLLPVLHVAARSVNVGPHNSIPQAKAIPHFGKHAKEARGEGKATARAKRDVENDAEAETDAQRICQEKYDFLARPICVDSWQEFKQGLQRLALEWSLAPGPGGVFVLRIYDRSEHGEGLLCQMKGNGNLCTPIADFFDGCGQITQGTTFQHDIRFADSKDVTFLRLEAKHSLPEPGEHAPPKDIMWLPQYDCRGTQVNLSVLDDRTGLRTPLFHSIPLQVLNYHFLTSLPLFLKRNDIGVKNTDFVSKEQMQHFRFAWCFLRRESWMTPVEMGELDNLLPP